MRKPVVILADLDESYIVTLETKFLKELKDKIELEVITDREYFGEYFKNPRQIDLLVVDEELYFPDLEKHSIGSLYVLSEMLEQGGTENLSICKLYKYTSVKEMFNELASESLNEILKNEITKKETQVIAVYSPIGGGGVTTLAVGLAAALSKNHKKVLFLSTESLQSFQFYLHNQGFLPNKACAALKNGTAHPYMELKDYIRNEIFNYLPPFYASLSAIGISFEVYKRLIEDIRMSKDYDYIIVDMETGFQEDKAILFSIADKILFVLMQDRFSIQKAESLTHNLELKGNEKFLFVCNQFQKEMKNYFVESKLQESVRISEYIEKISLEEVDNILKLDRIEELQQLSYLFI